MAAGVLEMRARMLEGHPNKTELFDVKHDRGGMVDLEFIVQYLVLAYSSQHPELVNNFGTTLLTEMAAGLGLIDKDLAMRSVSAYRHYRNIQREIRLSRGETVKARAAVLALWRSVFGTDEPRREAAAAHDQGDQDDDI